jgi:DNA-binding CsgD family transcriptional regulator
MQDRLDEKLMRVNRRRWKRLRTWGEVLDAAGWCVSLPNVEGGIWLSPNARNDLRDGGAPPADRHVGGEVRIWAGLSAGHNLPDPLAALTSREREVFNWIRAGKSDAEISVILGCAVRTVEKHVANLYHKLGVKNRVAAIFNSTHPAR